MAFGNQYGIDLAAIGQAQEAREGNALRKLIADKQLKQMQREEETDNALGALYAPTLTAAGLDPEVAKKVGGKGAAAYLTNQEAVRKARFEKLQKEAPIVQRLFSGVKDPESYAAAVAGARQSGIEGAEKLPMMYDPNIVQQMVKNAAAVAGPPKYDIKEGANGFVGINQEDLSVTPIQGATPYRAPRNVQTVDLADGVYTLNPDGTPGKKIGEKYQAPDNTLTEIYDPNSPTGGKMVPRAQAAGQPSAPGSGMKIESDGQGGFKLTQGKGAQGGFNAPTVNDIDKQLVANAARQTRLYDISSGFKPEFLTYSDRAKNWAAGEIEKIAPGLVGEDTKKNMADFTVFRQRAFDDLNQTLKEMSGAAITPQEAERLLKVLGDPSNDSPTQFKAKLDEVIRNVRLSQARLMYLRTQGPEGAANMAKVGLNDIPGIMRKRETELLREAKAANAKAGEDELKALVLPRLREEFGL